MKPGAASNGSAIDLQSVTKVYGTGVLALDRLELQVPRGEVFGLLGPNGAGKTTLVKILTHLVRPTECRGRVLGRPAGDASLPARIGYLPENPSWPSHFTTGQALDFAGRLHGLPERIRRNRVDRLLEMTGLEAWRRDRPEFFSKGMRQRLAFAWAMMGDPELLILDEPTDGVDPVGRMEMRNLIAGLRDQGRTIFVNSHLLGELELICDRVGILSRGRLVRSGTIDELTRESTRYEVVVGGSVMETPDILQLIHQLDGSVALSPDGMESWIRLPTRRPHVVQPVIDEVRKHGFIILSVAPARQSLEELFMDAIRVGGPGGDGR